MSDRFFHNFKRDGALEVILVLGIPILDLVTCTATGRWWLVGAPGVVGNVLRHLRPSSNPIT